MSFDIDLSGMTLFWVIVGGVVALLIETLLFKAACALGDANDPSWLTAFAVAVLFLAALGEATWVSYLLFKQNLEGLALCLAAITVGTLVLWLVCTALYSLVLSVSLKKGFFTAGAQALLDTIIGALAIGIALVVVSIVQINNPKQKTGQAPAERPQPVAALLRPADR